MRKILNGYYDDIYHIYYDKNYHKIPSVSVVLRMQPIEPSLNKWLHNGNKYDGLEMAQRFGNMTHEYMHTTMDGKQIQYKNTSMDKMIQKMTTWGISQLQEFKTIGMEMPTVSSLGFGGTPDRWGTLSGQDRVIIDFKSNKKTESEFRSKYLHKYSLQLTGYDILLSETGFEANMGIILHLFSETKYEVYFAIYRDKFMELVNIAHGKEMFGVPMRNIIDLWNSGMYVDEISGLVDLDVMQVNTILDYCRTI
jgi:hypothetical protein